MQYLLTSQIQMYIDSGRIKIEGFDQRLLEKDHYRFRAHEFKHKGKIVDSVVLKPLDYALCLSDERFVTGENIVADISQTSKHVLAGVILNKSDYIDRKFSGRLRLGLFNMSQNDVTIEKGAIVGKVYFYKVCDEEFCGYFDLSVDASPIKTDLKDIFAHRAACDDFDEQIGDFGRQWY